jgi:predicted amidophosphoribosyltransferase
MEKNVWNAGSLSLLCRCRFILRKNVCADLTSRHILQSIITGIPWDDSLVLKIRNTKSQKKLDAAQRRNNLRKAYEVTRELEGIPVLITDDVYTTGSTMDAMSMCLFEAGAQAVYFLTVCAGRQ